MVEHLAVNQGVAGSSPAASAKECCVCRAARPLDEFHRHRRNPDGRQSCCKGCMKVRNRAYYLATPDRNAQRQESRARGRRAAAAYVLDYLRQHGCVDCPEDDPIVLEFDHVRGVKDMDVSLMVQRGFSVQVVTAEIAKCDVRCANCHRRATYRRGGFTTKGSISPA